ncbi:hypothetical protein RM844_15230 [Streptomyces sp. DSM 44915]|uniref:Uncharacterized protein n=1 Tax=Streptomyces chisholmiae TaxID=3075540 RepID=A0ABU2JSD2_9ACTN|nr:hypothetical protein [Streptomyces sp. DSM 44915]MDT0267639.1 hypothetical protein [Streptomyces sp. DSM 44915]
MTPLPAWPPPPTAVRRLLHPDGPEGDAADALEAPHPWDLCALTGDLAEAVWTWLDDVAVWLNATYAAQDHQVIPACWPHHPSIAHDLAALAFSRLDVYQASTAAYVGRWHHDLEDLHRRMTTTLGPNSPCHRGNHDAHPRQLTAEAANHAITTRAQSEPPAP